MFGSEVVSNFKFRIHWQKPYTIYMKCQMCVHPDLTNLEDTSYNGPCSDANVDCALKLQYYQHINIKHYTALAVKRPLRSHIST